MSERPRNILAEEGEEGYMVDSSEIVRSTATQIHII